MTAQQITTLIKGLQDAIKEFNDTAKRGQDGSRAFEDSITGVLRSVDSFTSGVTASGRALTDFSRLSIGGSNSFKELSDVISTADGALSNFINSINTLPILGDLAKPITDSISQVSGVFDAAMKSAVGFANIYDGMDKGTRENTNTQYKYAAALGLTFEQAQKNTAAFQDLIKANSDFARSNIYFDGEQFKNGINAMQSAGISMEELSRASSLSTNGMNNMQMMTMQSRAMGMDISEYSRKMSDMVRKSGLSMEDSMKLMAGAQQISSETGLKLDEVTQSLESATNGFQRMGTTMDFGRPVLKGFAESVKEVGLGVAQAGELAGEFSRSLLGIVNNPALAYVTAMKGGFGPGMGGGGGVLNPSIQMQAMMLDKNPESQAELAKNLSTGMREMLASTTGGDIITLKQAAASPELQTQFYAQQQMLGSVYGINDTTTQSRVLEYLSDLEKATAAGDDELVRKINDQIKDATNANDKTLDIQQKISQSIDKSLVLMQEQINILKLKYGEGMEKSVMDSLNVITEVGNKVIEGTATESDKDRQAAAKKTLDSFVGKIADNTKNAADKGAQVTQKPDDSQMNRASVPNKEVASSVSLAAELKVTSDKSTKVELKNAKTSSGIASFSVSTTTGNLY